MIADMESIGGVCLKEPGLTPAPALSLPQEDDVEEKPPSFLTLAQGAIGLVVAMISIGGPVAIWAAGVSTRQSLHEDQISQIRTDIAASKAENKELIEQMRKFESMLSQTASDVAVTKTNISWMSDYYHRQQRGGGGGN